MVSSMQVFQLTAILNASYDYNYFIKIFLSKQIRSGMTNVINHYFKNLASLCCYLVSLEITVIPRALEKKLKTKTISVL